MLTAVGLSLVLLVVMAATGDAGPPRCAVLDSHGRCLVIAVDPGRPGRVAPDRDESPGRSGPDDDGAEAADDAGPSPEPRRPRSQAVPLGDGGFVQQAPLDPADFLEPVPADVAPAVDPVVVAAALAQRAIEQLTLDPPLPRTSTTDTGYVGVPVWLWIDDTAASTGPVSATATAGAAQVTATGRLSGVEWSMGPAGGEVRCAGPGTPWDGQAGSSPDCGYTYEQRSLPERTGGSGRWTVVTTGVWTVTWTGVSGGLPVDGVETVRISEESSLGVGEIQVLVGGTR